MSISKKRNILLQNILLENHFLKSKIILNEKFELKVKSPYEIQIKGKTDLELKEYFKKFDPIFAQKAPNGKFAYEDLGWKTSENFTDNCIKKAKLESKPIEEIVQVEIKKLNPNDQTKINDEIKKDAQKVFTDVNSITFKELSAKVEEYSIETYNYFKTNYPELTHVMLLKTVEIRFDLFMATLDKIVGANTSVSYKNSLNNVKNKLKPEFYKSASDRTVPVRYGKSYSEIDAEYNALKKMNELDSNFIKPINLKPGEGYSMENFDGIELQEYLNSGKKIPIRIMNQMIAAVSKIHQNGIVHGDLKTNNILISRDGTTFRIIDPVGYPTKSEGFKDFEKAKNDEINDLRNIFKDENLERGSVDDLEFDLYGSNIPLYPEFLGITNELFEGIDMDGISGSAPPPREMMVMRETSKLKDTFSDEKLNSMTYEQYLDIITNDQFCSEYVKDLDEYTRKELYLDDLIREGLSFIKMGNLEYGLRFLPEGGFESFGINNFRSWIKSLYNHNRLKINEPNIRIEAYNFDVLPPKEMINQVNMNDILYNQQVSDQIEYGTTNPEFNLTDKNHNLNMSPEVKKDLIMRFRRAQNESFKK